MTLIFWSHKLHEPSDRKVTCSLGSNFTVGLGVWGIWGKDFLSRYAYYNNTSPQKGLESITKE